MLFVCFLVFFLLLLFFLLFFTSMEVVQNVEIVADGDTFQHLQITSSQLLTVKSQTRDFFSVGRGTDRFTR